MVEIQNLVTAQIEYITDFPSDEDSEFFGGPITEPVSPWAGRDTNLHSDAHAEFSNRPVMELVTARETDTEEPLVMNVSPAFIEVSELGTSVLGDTDASGIPVYEECRTPEFRNPVIALPDAHAQLAISDIQWNSRDCCFGVCKKADSVN